MTGRNTTQLGAPGPRPLGGPIGNGTAGTPAGATSMTLGTLREVRNELASLGDLLERMSRDMNGLRKAVETVAARGGETDHAGADEAARKMAKKASKRAARADDERAEREAALTARVEKLERRVKILKRRLDWQG